MLPLYDLTKETSVLAYAYPEQSNGLWLCFLSPHKYEVRYTQTERESLAATWANKHLCEYLIRKRVYLETDHKPLVISPQLLALPKYREVLYTESYQKNLTMLLLKFTACWHGTQVIDGACSVQIVAVVIMCQEGIFLFTCLYGKLSKALQISEWNLSYVYIFNVNVTLLTATSRAIAWTSWLTFAWMRLHMLIAVLIGLHNIF